MQQAATAAPIASRVSLIPVLSDNYVFVLHGDQPGPAVVVDPAVAEPVISWLEQRQLELTAILHTHHHHDHIGGTPQLLQHWPQAAVIASSADLARIPLQTQGVQGGDRFELLGRSVQVIDVPGHTAHAAPSPITSSTAATTASPIDDTMTVRGRTRPTTTADSRRPPVNNTQNMVTRTVGAAPARPVASP